MSNIVNLLNGLEFLYPEGFVISQMKRTLSAYPECEKYLVDAYSLGQLKSKNWLIENLPNDMGLVFICAGWYGTLASMMFNRCNSKFDKIRSFDIDPSCAAIADTLNKPWVMDGWKFKASTVDILEMQYPTTYTTYRANGTSLDLVETPDTIINTSCEHIADFGIWYNAIPTGTIVALQGNDFFEVTEHVNCSKNLEEFNNMAPMRDVHYLGELALPKYKRFMKIGIK